MMKNKELKESIERLNNLCENDRGEYIKAGWLGRTNILAIEKVLEEVESQQTKQEKIKNKIKQMLIFCENDSNGEKICRLQIKFYEKLLKELE